ncbi:hypothetical protein KY285_017029 [Solanum tuberosum]|nr:hypothetical protein KY285_017029 [Solanum tuberosum]
MAETVSPQPRAVDETPEKPSYASISNPSTYTQKSDGKLPLKLKPVIYVHGEPTMSFNFLDLESYIQEENLQYALVAKFSYGRPDKIDLRKSFTRHFAIKGDCNLGLLDHRHVLMFAREALFSLASAVGTPLQVDKATTGKLRPSVARGHKEEECRLTMEVEGGLIDETKINGAKFKGDLRSILDEKKKVLSLQQTGKEQHLETKKIQKLYEKFGQYEGLHVTDELSAESGNTLDLDKQIEQIGQLKQCCHDEHTNQQALVTHEKEFIATEKIDGKEINLNTPTIWADLVEEENHTPSPSRSKLSPQALEFVLTSKTNPSMAVIGTSSNLSATKVNVADRDNLYDLDNDMSDGDDEDHEDDEEEMLDICFDKVAKEGDLSPRQQRSGSTKCKKKTHGRQHSWDGKVSGDFVPRRLPMRLAKQNHMTVSTTLSRSNKFKK